MINPIHNPPLNIDAAVRRPEVVRAPNTPRPVDPRLRWAVLNQLARMATEPCECAARRERTKLPPDALGHLKPEHVECRGCLAAKALTRAIKER